jgi:PAS domain S-box-containing protein
VPVNGNGKYGASGDAPFGHAELLRALSSHTLVGIVMIADGKIVYANDGVTILTGMTPSELMARGPGEFFDYIHPDDREMTMDRFSRRFAGEEGLPDQYDLRVLHRDGSLKWASIRPEWVELGKTRTLVVSFVDITERTVAEQARSVSEERYRNLFDHAPIGIAVLDTEGRVLDVNREATEIIHVPADALVGQMLADYETANVHIVDRLLASIRTLLDRGWVAPFEVEARDPSVEGGPLWLELFPSLLGEPGDSRYVHVMVRDITARRQAEREKRDLEAQLRHRQKLESIGTLAAGVAHEINNPVTGIINFAQVISRRADPESGLGEFAQSIIAESWRVSDIVKSLLAFSRQERVLVGSMELREIVDDTLMLVGAMLREDQIAIDVDVPADLPRVNCRGQQIQQVLMNVITNARDAVRERFPNPDERAAPDRSITITGSAFTRDGTAWTRLTVTDPGTGINPDISDRIFDPFFTTKPPPHGTGLGLAVSYGIVQEHGGALTFESKPGEGTRFCLDLPVSGGGDL